jgi:hypothetical protein
VNRAPEIPDSGIERAALAYSLLPVRFADAVNEHLSITERQRLREGLARVREASDYARAEAIRALTAAVRKGVVFPRPAAHDHRDCPFHPIGAQPRNHVVEVLERVARRDPLEVVVTLCHLDEEVRQSIWEHFRPDTRALLLPRLDEVHLLSVARTREYARSMNDRLQRSVRRANGGVA